MELTFSMDFIIFYPTFYSLGAFGNSISNLEKDAQASSFFPKLINVNDNLKSWSNALFPFGNC